MSKPFDYNGILSKAADTHQKVSHTHTLTVCWKKNDMLMDDNASCYPDNNL